MNRSKTASVTTVTTVTSIRVTCRDESRGSNIGDLLVTTGDWCRQRQAVPCPRSTHGLHVAFAEPSQSLSERAQNVAERSETSADRSDSLDEYSSNLSAEDAHASGSSGRWFGPRDAAFAGQSQQRDSQHHSFLAVFAPAPPSCRRPAQSERDPDARLWTARRRARERARTSRPTASYAATREGERRRVVHRAPRLAVIAASRGDQRGHQRRPRLPWARAYSPAARGSRSYAWLLRREPTRGPFLPRLRTSAVTPSPAGCGAITGA